MSKTATTTSLSVQEKHIKELAEAYKKKHGATMSSSGITWKDLEKYRNFVGLSDYDKAERIMEIASPHKHPNGNHHFWYLIAFPTERNTAIRNLRASSPWKHISRYRNFDDWRDHVKSSITKMKGIRELVWYDVALIIAYLLKQDIMPKEKVYVHAKPLWTAKKIMDYLTGYNNLKRAMNRDFCFLQKNAPKCLSILNAYEMEDFFCHIGHLLSENDNDITKVQPNMI